jgi:hypothetical protein
LEYFPTAADRYILAALWLHENTAPGTMIFQTGWEVYHDDYAIIFTLKE